MWKCFAGIKSHIYTHLMENNKDIYCCITIIFFLCRENIIICYKWKTTLWVSWSWQHWSSCQEETLPLFVSVNTMFHFQNFVYLIFILFDGNILHLYIVYELEINSNNYVVLYNPVSYCCCNLGSYWSHIYPR